MAAGSTRIADYFMVGTHAARPATPLFAPNSIVFYYETDTLNLFFYSSGWVLV